MSEAPGSGKGVAVVLALIVVVPLLVLSWLYPDRVAPFTVVFLLTGLVMLLRSRRASRRLPR